MARKVNFPLEMAEGVQVRNLGALKENFDIEKLMGYFLNGKLLQWLEARYYEKEAEAVAVLSKDDAQLSKKLCAVFGVEYTGDDADVEDIELRNERIARLRQFTDDDEIIKNVDLVAFDQEDLAALYDEGAEKIYLCEGEFRIPKSKQELEYIILGGAKAEGLEQKEQKEKQKEKDRGKAEYFIKKRYIFDSSIEETKMNENSDIYNRIVNTLYRKYADGTEEMISDETEYVSKYIDAGDGLVYYITFSLYEEQIVGRIYSRKNSAQKCLIAYSDDFNVTFIYADGRRVLYMLGISRFYNNIYGNSIYCAECDRENSGRRICDESDFNNSLLEPIGIIKNNLWIRTKENGKLWRVVFSDLDNINKTLIQENINLAEMENGVIYMMAHKDGSYKFYKADAVSRKIEYIADALAKSVSQFAVCGNKIVYLDRSPNTLFGFTFTYSLSLRVLDIKTRKTKTLDDNFYDALNLETEKLRISENVIYYATQRSDEYPVKCKINLDGSGKSVISESEAEEIFGIGTLVRNFISRFAYKAEETKE